jgi:hypothetical protein
LANNKNKHNRLRNTTSNFATNTNGMNRHMSSDSANNTTAIEHNTTFHTANAASNSQLPPSSTRPVQPKQARMNTTRTKQIRGLAYATIQQANMAGTPAHHQHEPTTQSQGTSNPTITTIAD